MHCNQLVEAIRYSRISPKLALRDLSLVLYSILIETSTDGNEIQFRVMILKHGNRYKDSMSGKRGRATEKVHKLQRGAICEDMLETDYLYDVTRRFKWSSIFF